VARIVGPVEIGKQVEQKRLLLLGPLVGRVRERRKSHMHIAVRHHLARRSIVERVVRLGWRAVPHQDVRVTVGLGEGHFAVLALETFARGLVGV
jgi:hypothetical protein